jgi:hypothetical protein
VAIATELTKAYPDCSLAVGALFSKRSSRSVGSHGRPAVSCRIPPCQIWVKAAATETDNVGTVRRQTEIRSLGMLKPLGSVSL